MKLIALALYLRKLLPARTESSGRLTRLLPLVLALSLLPAFGEDNGHFSRSGFGHNWEWAKNLALAENLSPEHNLRPSHPDPDGTPAAFGAMYNREYAEIVAGEPAARSEFDVYVHEGQLSYVKEPCGEGDTQDPFFLHLLPADENDLPEWSRPYGFENKDFDFGEHGGVFDGKCLATVPLPEYDIDGFRTGQVVPGEGRAWQVAFGAMYDREYVRIVASAPAASAEFDVYVHEGQLSYVKEPCREGDILAPFFLHLLPADENDLPESSKPHGFENRDFDFGAHGGVFDEKCLATVPLPEYDIDGFRTGQYSPGEGRSWQVDNGISLGSHLNLILKAILHRLN